MTSIFRSLKGFNYRAWAIGAFVSNIGTWMQRVGQDWLVLTVLTHNDARAVGVVMALQFGPQIVLLPLSGYAADHFDRRRVLMVTQASLGLLALGLGVLTIAGLVQLWQVYAFALALGIATAFDVPVRQSFVSELVPLSDLPNAVALNSTSFHAARMVGPAVAGLMISAIGTGWVFAVNGLSFAGVLAALALMRREELHRVDRPKRAPGALLEGFRYVWQRQDLRSVMSMIFLIGTFGLNFPIFISTMAVTAFHVGAGRYGLLTSMMAIGSVSGALLAAHRGEPKLWLLAAAGALFGVGCALAAVMPTYYLFGLMLIVVGLAGQTFMTSTNTFVQLSAEPGMRGRVVAILFAIAMGGTPIGAPIVGWVAAHYGPRWSLMVGAASGIAAAAVGFRYLRARTSVPAAGSA